MLSDITIGQYYKADSLVHKLDARTKLLLTLWFIIIIFLCKNFLSLILVMAFVSFCVLMSKVPFKMFLKSHPECRIIFYVLDGSFT